MAIAYMRLYLLEYEKVKRAVTSIPHNASFIYNQPTKCDCILLHPCDMDGQYVIKIQSTFKEDDEQENFSMLLEVLYNGKFEPERSDPRNLHLLGYRLKTLDGSLWDVLHTVSILRHILDLQQAAQPMLVMAPPMGVVTGMPMPQPIPQAIPQPMVNNSNPTQLPLGVPMYIPAGVQFAPLSSPTNSSPSWNSTSPATSYPSSNCSREGSPHQPHQQHQSYGQQRNRRHSGTHRRNIKGGVQPSNHTQDSLPWGDVTRSRGRSI